MKLICNIPHESESYEIEIRSGALQQLPQSLAILKERVAIISDDIVAALYGEALREAFASLGLEAYLFPFPHGEQNKTRETKEQLENRLFEKGLGRDTCVIALGGGVATDVAGYLAATFCRGVPYVQVPTSLLGMVDASIGGKTGVNVPYGKNLLGCIYQPKKVVIDPSTLKSLPANELSNGVVEMIKHGLIADRAFFEYLDTHAHQILSLDPPTLEKAIFESCRIKKEIVEQDEKEKGRRHLLNFGHTIGHALERLTHYALSHGEAVAIGLLVESRLSPGGLSLSDKIRQILSQYGLPLRLPCRLPVESILEAMALDKKARQGKPRFVMIDGIGSSLSCGEHYCAEVAEPDLRKALQWMQEDLCRH